MDVDVVVLCAARVAEDLSNVPPSEYWAAEVVVVVRWLVWLCSWLCSCDMTAIGTGRGRRNLKIVKMIIILNWKKNCLLIGLLKFGFVICMCCFNKFKTKDIQFRKRCHFFNLGCKIWTSEVSNFWKLGENYSLAENYVLTSVRLENHQKLKFN